MCKKHINVAITLSIILFVFAFFAVIAYYDFFTKENILKSTIEKADINNINEFISENEVIENTYTQISILYLNETNEEVEEEVNIENTHNDIQKEETKVSTPNVSNSETTVTESVQPVTQSYSPASIGRIEIPKFGINITLFKEMSLEGMNSGACLLFTTGSVNNSGNSLILAHNYSNFFGNNKNLNIGDKIYVTTSDGKKIEYTVYNKI